MVELVIAAAQRNSSIEVAIDDFAAHIAQRFDAGKHRQADEGAAQKRNEDRCDKTPHECPSDGSLHFMELDRAQADKQKDVPI